MILALDNAFCAALAGWMLWSHETYLGAGLALVTLGCTLSSFLRSHRLSGLCGLGPWSVLPISALCELAGLTIYAINILGTFVLEPRHAQKQPLVVGVAVKIS